MLSAYYETPLVLVSILVAIFASYTALSLADRVTHSTGRAALWWIAGGAVAMGIGIWSMHFIGMLAFRLPIPIAYDPGLTLFSLMLPIVVSGSALWQASQPKLSASGLAVGALLMGSGIASMHYSGMAAMRMQPGIDYDVWLVILSVAIAILASAAALWIAFALRARMRPARLLRAASAVVMGVAIVGMHYTGMAAARFPLGSICTAARGGFNPDGLAILVIIVSAAVLTIALLASVFDARLASSAHGLAASQAISEERQALLHSERMARQHAERMNLMKDEFLATLSHELRTPLSAILGWSQILKNTVKEEGTLSKGLDTIERNARAQAQLIDDLLDMSRIISGKIILDTELVDPVTVVTAAIDTIRPAAVAKNISLDETIAADVGPVFGDPNRLQQILWNLLSNAVKFTPKDGVIRVRLAASDDEVVVEVSDSGIGIDPAFLPFVFDRFRQADSSTTRHYGGLGLGLAIVKQLVESHGGWIRAESEGQGRGTRIVLGLPRYRHTHALREKKILSDTATPAKPAGFQPIDLSSVTVLVIDDEPDALELARHLLRACGATTLTATNARDGVALAQTVRPDVIVSDISMPDMDGFALVRCIRDHGDDKVRAIPVIALTAFARTEEKQRASDAGFTDYLIKPVEPSELVNRIAQAVAYT